VHTQCAVRSADARSVAFSSARLPTEHFDERFSQENLVFWVPLLIECAQIEAGHRVLDVGRETGGFARAIAESASAAVTGIDYSERFIVFAREVPAPQRGSVEWKVGSAEALPAANGSFDRVLLSLVLHQLQHPEIAVAEAFCALAAGGRVVVRTIAPEDVVDRVPERLFPSMAAADTERMPPVGAIERWLRDVGLVITERCRVLRNKKLNLAAEERQLLIEVHALYSFVSAAEPDAGLPLMRAEAKANEGGWIDPRPTHIIAASKTASIY
jgi:2-polyprenyl-3-methyl-5-hydroxy-6-metoxy-1,4-benzoquinol methylase